MVHQQKYGISGTDTSLVKEIREKDLKSIPREVIMKKQLRIDTGLQGCGARTNQHLLMMQYS